MAIIHVHGLLIIFFHIFPILFRATSSNTESEALLKLKESFTNAASLDSWRPGTEPCGEKGKWVGVQCQNGLVSGLRLGKLGLSGKINVDALTSLSGLRSVAFMLNAFSGPIPDFHRMGPLKGLYISGNHFSGEIPSDYFSKMVGLKKVWLSGNNFTGRVPSSLALLSQLIELHLENNQFSGPIPPLEQRSLVSVNFSNNNLEGQIPSGLSRFSANLFQGNPELCGGKSGRACDPFMIAKKALDKDNSTALVVVFWFIVALAVLLSVIVTIIYGMRRRRKEEETNYNELVKQNVIDDSRISSASRKNDVSSNQKSLGSGSNSRVGYSRKGSRKTGDLEIVNDEKGLFGMVDLMRAGAEVLGNGVLGSSFKATMDSGLTVVVKRVKEMNKLGKDKFDLEMRRLGSLKHKNVLTPLAYYYRKEEKLLVQEFQPKESLLLLLHGDRRMSPNEVNWAMRLKIIQGIARGLDFLHRELSSIELPHGDLKSSNVLLSEDYEPLLVDYGFYSLLNQGQAEQSLIAYRTPEAILGKQITPKCDVYFLGIMILEILTRKFPCQYLHHGQGGTDLVMWVRSAIGAGREIELLDPDIANTTNKVQEMQQFLHIGAACTEDEPGKRLGLGQAVGRIEGVVVREGGDGDGETRTFHVLPSLRDGYADQVDVLQAPVMARSATRQESVGGQSGRKSFTFEMS